MAKRKIFITLLSLLVAFSKFTSCSNKYIQVIGKVDRSNVGEVTIENLISQKMKKVTREDDIGKILQYTNSLKFKKFNGQDNVGVKYRIIIEDKDRSTEKIIVINIINSDVVFVKGKKYRLIPI
jgi:hypothetical protein